MKCLHVVFVLLVEEEAPKINGFNMYLVWKMFICCNSYSKEVIYYINLIFIYIHIKTPSFTNGFLDFVLETMDFVLCCISGLAILCF